MQQSLRAIVQVIEGECVTLAFDDGQTIHVPVRACGGELKVGGVVALSATALGSEDAGRTALAQELLNEILKT